MWGLALGWLPFGASVLAASDASLVPTGLTVPVLLAYMAAFGSAGYRVANFRCPRCGAMFFRTPLRWVRNPLARECRRCGLEKWAGARPLRHRAR